MAMEPPKHQHGNGDLLFDIEFLTGHFHTTNLGFYLEKIRSASPSALREVREALTEHKKGRVQHQAFRDVKGMSTHDALIAAVDFELLKRSGWFPLWRSVFPLRRLLASWLRGVDLKHNEHFGALPVQRAVPTTILHASVRESLDSLRAFWVKHWKVLATLAVGVAAVIVNWLKK